MIREADTRNLFVLASTGPMPDRTIYFVAGELSGDAIGARIIAALRDTDPHIRAVGIGGPAMAEQGLQSLFPISDIAVMGLAEVLPHLPTILRRLNEAERDIMERAPAAVVTIDAPGFCFRLAKRLKKRLGDKATLIHVVAPTVWAWKPKRARKSRRCTIVCWCCSRSSRPISNGRLEDRLHRPPGDLDQDAVRCRR